MKKYIAIALLILIIGFVWISNIAEKEVKRLHPAEDTLPEKIAEEVPNLYIEEQRPTISYAYIFDPKEYGTLHEVYVLIALGDIAMDFKVDDTKNVVELIPLYYPKLGDRSIVYDSKDFGDESEGLSYRFTMHVISIDNASEYEYYFALAEDPRLEFSRRIIEPGDIGARSASRLPELMKKRE